MLNGRRFSVKRPAYMVGGQWFLVEDGQFRVNCFNKGGKNAGKNLGN